MGGSLQDLPIAMMAGPGFGRAPGVTGGGVMAHRALETGGSGQSGILVNHGKAPQVLLQASY